MSTYGGAPPGCFSELTLERDETRDEEHQDCSQLRAGCERIEQPFFILLYFVVRDDIEGLSSEK